MKIISSMKAYIANPDPLTGKSCLVAAIIGANGPVYPFYLSFMIGFAAAAPAFITMLASPFFLAIPLLARFHPLAARTALPLLGTLNTFWCIKLLGASSGVELFLLPCISLAALSFNARERWLSFALLALPIGFYIVQPYVTGLATPLLHFSPAQLQALVTLNAASVGMLTAFLGLTYARLRG
ncbi:MAG: hypothetical protein KGQ79_00625 [Proteobacteria bacterium]|nr:hypothetical protein [Pseudomonadota bacterium]MBU6424885.1 hypothetical protein [Rhodospirillales bacterium]